MDYQLDDLDLKILAKLQESARTPYLEMAREFEVAGGTIHARVNRMTDLGIIKGSKILVDYQTLGFQVSALIGVSLTRAGDYKAALRKLRPIREVVEVHYTTGTFGLLLKVMVKGIPELRQLIAEKLQAIDEIHSTETFVVLDTPISRDLSLHPR